MTPAVEADTPPMPLSSALPSSESRCWMTARRSLVSSSARPCWSAQWKIRPSVDSCVALSPSTFDSRIGPNAVIVARTGTPIPEAPSERNRTGNAVGAQSSPVSWARFVVRSLGSPGRARPERSPLTSASSTGTPAAEHCSARFCSVLVLPVPVAPATRPWRFSVAKGMRTRADLSGASSIITAPSSSAAPSVAYPAAISAAAFSLTGGRLAGRARPVAGAHVH